MRTSDVASERSPVIDLNSDVGEGFGDWRLGADDSLFPYITSANVACGFHAGDPRTILHTIERAASHGVSVGAHPGFLDLVGFGRREVRATPLEIRTDVLYQLGAISAFCHVVGAPLCHVKPHGALYNLATTDAAVATAIAAAIRAFDPSLRLFALPGSMLASAGHEAGLSVVLEAFADRAYRADGTLVARSEPGSLVTDSDVAVRRMLHLVHHGRLDAVTGEALTMQPGTLCIHSDTPGAGQLAHALHEAFAADGIRVASPADQQTSV